MGKLTWNAKSRGTWHLSPRSARRLAARGALIAAALAVSGAALAQQTPSPTPAPGVPPPPAFRPNEQDRRNFYVDRGMNGSESNEFTDRYGQALNITQCIARRHSDKLAKFLDQPEGSGGEQQAVGDLMRSARSCSGDKVRVSMKELRGAAAEALLKHIDTPDPASARSTNPNLEKDFYSSLPQGDSLQTVANCQVTQAPAAVRKYIDAAPGAQGSDKLNSDVVAASETCGDIGTKDPETAVLYRAYLAETLYRWSLAGGGKNSS